MSSRSRTDETPLNALNVQQKQSRENDRFIRNSDSQLSASRIKTNRGSGESLTDRARARRKAPAFLKILSGDIRAKYYINSETKMVEYDGATYNGSQTKV